MGAAVTLAFSGAYAADATLSNGSLTAVINDGGTFGVSPTHALGSPGLSYNGVEFVNIDTPSSWWRLQSSAGDVTAQYNSNPLGSTTTGLGSSVATTFDGSLSFVQTVSLTAPNQISFQVSLKNTTGRTITGVYFGTGIDPDQGGSGKNATSNTILAQNSNASVRAVDTLYGTNASITLTNTTSAAAFDIKAYINSGDCCSAVSPSFAHAANQAVGFSTLADDSISLAYDIGTMAAGQVVTIGYNYTLQAVPEPETYAMLMAGLGLMGVVARRRKQATSV